MINMLKHNAGFETTIDAKPVRTRRRTVGTGSRAVANLIEALNAAIGPVPDDEVLTGGFIPSKPASRTGG